MIEIAISEARKRIAAMDEIDKASGGVDYPIPLSVAIGNAMEALKTAISIDDLETARECAADAFVMLEQTKDPSMVEWGTR